LDISNFKPGIKLTEGKTKEIWTIIGRLDLVIIKSKDDLTAGDGAKHDVLPGKGALANTTTCNVFRYLYANGIPLAFIAQMDETRFIAERCRMIPYEVVVRREARGSYLKRHPELTLGHRFDQPLLEFFLKTGNRHWGDIAIPKDDPLIRFEGEQAQLFLPDQPIEQQEPFLILNDFPLLNTPNKIGEIGRIAIATFLTLEKAWQRLDNGRLVDFKLEFGLIPHRKIVVADVIDNDSWRVVDRKDEYLDKQVYRDGGDLAVVEAKYRQVAELTARFGQP
jgi:phosphoribosylaminoimidazole-succinocarboxamide synthase